MIIIYNKFQRFWGSKLLNSCFNSLTNVCEECNNFQAAGFKIDVYDQ